MSQKWQRLRYMPVVPMGEDGRRLTAGEKHIALAREAAAEGMVLLKNEGGLLPFAKGTRLALFGKAQADYVKGGGGSGDTTVSYVRSLIQVLEIKEREGKVSLFAPLNDYYTEYVRQQYAAGAEPGRCPEAPVPETQLAEARAFTDTAVIALCRFSGEGWDRSGTPYDGDFYLSRGETTDEAMLHARTYLKQLPADYAEGNSRSEELYNQFRDAVEHYFHRYADVAFYAEQLNVSPRYLGQVTRRIAERSPKSIIDERITTEIALLLTTTNKPLKEIALQLGFSSQAHLSRYFKKQKGVSPSEYKHN